MGDDFLLLDGDVEPSTSPSTRVPRIPDYLEKTYAWAYLNPRNVRLLDRPLVVSTILWGNFGRLLRALLTELKPGQTVLQPACVYGNFSPSLAAFLGPQGRLDVFDVAPIQVERCRHKLARFPQATVRLRDAVDPVGGSYDAVCCFFLLHELPDRYKRLVVDALLSSVAPGGKAVFVDYHKPHPAHPLKALTGLIFDLLEPFAKGLWEHEIKSCASGGDTFSWSKKTYFGGLFQKVVATRLTRAPG
jgi:SAM-dependent methyltransferase